MEGKKVKKPCRNCQEELTIDFTTARYSTEIQITNGRKQHQRTFFEKCPHCGTVNTVTSTDKQEWGNRKGPNIKLFLFSGLFSCLTFAITGLLLLYFAFKGLGFVFEWLAA